MNLNEIVMAIMAGFFVLGGVDRCLGNRFGFGVELENGIKLMGTVALCILGMGCIAPVLAQWLQPVLLPVYHLVGADPAMFGGSFLSSDAGGYAMAAALTDDAAIACFSGLIVGPFVGSNLTYSIPLACGMIKKESVRYFAAGMLSGMMLSPIGCILGGLAAGLPIGVIMVNLVPVIALALVIVLGLAFAPNVTIRIFRVVARFVTALITIGLMLGAVQRLTGFTVFSNMNPITDGFVTVGTCAMVLGGAMPMVRFVERVAAKPLARLGKAIRIDPIAVSAILASIASVIPMFTHYDEMSVRSKVVVAGFAATAANILGAHVGFAAAVNSDYVVPLIAAKLCVASLSIPVSIFFCNRLFRKEMAAEAAGEPCGE